MSTELNDDFDLSFANGSMKDLVLRMGDIDKELDEIALISNGNGNSNNHAKKVVDDDYDYDNDYDNDNDEHQRPKDNVHSLELSAGDGLEFSDREDDDGLDDLTKELQHLDEAACTEKEQASAAAVVESSPAPVSTTTTTSENTIDTTTTTATILKPTPTSSVGISMKTSQGKTRIIAFSPGGLLSNMATNVLQVGMEIISINDTPIRNARQARQLIVSSPIEVSITCTTSSS
jgi:hypothetical protein